MKKITLLLLAIILTSNCMADEHLMFKGIEINGSLRNFKNELVKQGYVIEETGDDIVALKGKFAGYDNCIILVSATPSEKTVYSVMVILPTQDSWYSLKSRYNEFKESLIKKYGSPSKDIHSFISPYYEGDGYEMQALDRKKCNYAAFFQTKIGDISIMISGNDYREGRVIIMYADKANSALNERAGQETLSNDL